MPPKENNSDTIFCHPFHNRRCVTLVATQNSLVINVSGYTQAMHVNKDYVLLMLYIIIRVILFLLLHQNLVEPDILMKEKVANIFIYYSLNILIFNLTHFVILLMHAKSKIPVKNTIYALYNMCTVSIV